MADPRSNETAVRPVPDPGRAGSVRVEFGAASDVGKVRAVNQDHYLIMRLGRSLDVVRTNLPEGEVPERIEESAYGMVVADGMGGMSGGEKASVMAIRTGVRLVYESQKWAMKIDEQEARMLTDRMRVYFQRVDAALIRHTEFEPALSGMGTTLTVAYSVGPHAFVVHAGDSRAYHVRAGALRQLTRDHTVAQSLADAGRIRREEVERHAAGHILTNYAGGPRLGIEPEVVTVELADGDGLLLCTDGLTKMVAEAEIAEILVRHPRPEDAARALIDRALLYGGRDNVTAVLARYKIPGEDGG